MEREERGGEGGAPISPDASFTDGLLLLGKITPLVVRSPRWLYYLHGRAFICLQERKRSGGEKKSRVEKDRQREERERERQTAFLEILTARPATPRRENRRRVVSDAVKEVRHFFFF